MGKLIKDMRAMNKGILVIIIVLFSKTVLLSQINEIPDLKGKFILGGSINYEKNKTDSYSHTDEMEHRTTANIGPDIGYYLSNSMAIGCEFLFSKVHFKFDERDGTTFKNLYLNSFVRYYFPYGLFTQEKFGFASELDDFDNLVWLLEAGVGYSYFISDNISLDLIFKYQYLTSDAGLYFLDNYKVKTLGFDIGFQIQIN